MDAQTAHRVDAAQGQAGYETAYLRAKTTGLPFVVFISQRVGARHDVRVKVAAGPKVLADQMASYQLRPFQHTDGPRLAGHEETLLQRWADLNLETLVRYWNGEIEYTEDAIEALKPL